jgi:hypothetical protein
MLGVLVIVGALLFIPSHHQSIGFVFTKTINASGSGGHGLGSLLFWFAIGLGLLQAQYTIGGPAGVVRRTGRRGLPRGQSGQAGSAPGARFQSVGYLVTRFLPGQQPSAEQLRTPAMLGRVTAALRILHHGEPIPGVLDPFAVTGRTPA